MILRVGRGVEKEGIQDSILMVCGGDSVARARAAALLIGGYDQPFFRERGRYTIIVFTGGHTSGKSSPSEARQMYRVFRRMIRGQRSLDSFFPEDRREKHSQYHIQIDQRDITILLEEGAVDTTTNARNTLQMIDEYHQSREESISFSLEEDRSIHIHTPSEHLYIRMTTQIIVARIDPHRSLVSETPSPLPSHPYRITGLSQASHIGRVYYALAYAMEQRKIRAHIDIISVEDILAHHHCLWSETSFWRLWSWDLISTGSSSAIQRGIIGNEIWYFLIDLALKAGYFLPDIFGRKYFIAMITAKATRDRIG